jgi:peptidoglycan/LPS O-acetylase OafA/YrhL
LIARGFVVSGWALPLVAASLITLLLQPAIDNGGYLALLTAAGVRYPLAGLIWSGLILACARMGLWGRAVSIAPLSALGRVSYSVYLVHWPIMATAALVTYGLVLAPGLGIAGGIIFYRAVERPCLSPTVRSRVVPVLARLFRWIEPASWGWLQNRAASTAGVETLPITSGEAT